MAKPSLPRKSFWDGWLSCNFFKLSVGDAGAYFLFYIFIPVCIIGLTLTNIPTDKVAKAYFYVTVLVSSGNCIYDAINRRTPEKSVYNLKVALICIPNVVISGYCLVELFSFFIVGIFWECNWLLFFYAPVVIIGLTDGIYCILRNVSLFEYIQCEETT